MPQELFPLVGRAVELRRLSDALERTAAGRGGAIFLAGEAGIGKTRLAHEALVLARMCGFQVLEGRAYPMESGLAYAPLLDAFNPALRGRNARQRAALVADLPELGRLFGGLDLPVPESLGDPALEKTRLFEAVAQLLTRLAQLTPVLLFVDDLHWADPASLELLHYLTRGLARQSVLVLGSYRTDEVDGARGLRTLLKSLRRTGSFGEVLVPRLSQQEVAVLAGSMLGTDAPEHLVSLLSLRTGGTPLFVQELLQALLDAGLLTRRGNGWALGADADAVLPPGIQDLILDRLERLAQPERGVLELVAVCGKAALHSVLASVSGLDEELLLAALQRLRAAGLLTEERAGESVVYTLSHPLIQEVAYAELSEMARRRIHATVVAALERLYPDDVDQLARHYRGAGTQVDQERALEVLIAAGQRAHDLHASDEAAQYFGAALTLTRHGRRSDLLPALLEWLGEAWEGVGETSAAAEVWTEALAIFERRGDGLACGRLHRLLAQTEWERGNFSASQAHLRAGLAALDGLEPSDELARLLQTRLTILGRLGDAPAIAHAASDLLALAERLHSPRAEVETHQARVTSLPNTDLVAALRACSRIAAQAEADGELLLALRAHVASALAAIGQGDHRSTRLHSQHSLKLSVRFGAPALATPARIINVAAEILAGDWHDAFASSAAGVELARRVGLNRMLTGLLATRAWALALRGELSEAQSLMNEARAFYGSGTTADRHIFGQVDVSAAILALERGDFEQALGIAAVFTRAAGPVPALSLAVLGESQAAAGRIDEALATAGGLEAIAAGWNRFGEALAARVAGLAYRAAGQREQAMQNLERASALFRDLEMPFEAARARLEWVSVAAAGRPATAVNQVRESFAVFERLGAQLYVERARTQLKELGVQPPVVRRARADGILLSAREIEVARLVTEGLSNAEIAQRLVLSPRTVTTHLDRIYARLEINSRAALARYVTEVGLLNPE